MSSYLECATQRKADGAAAPHHRYPLIDREAAAQLRLQFVLRRRPMPAATARVITEYLVGGRSDAQ